MDLCSLCLLVCGYLIRGMRVKSVKSPNDSSSATAEGGGGLAQPVPNGGAQENRPESADAPDAEAQAVTDRSRTERFAAAPLLAFIAFRLEFRGERSGMQWRLVA